MALQLEDHSLASFPMRSAVTTESIHCFMERLGKAVSGDGRVYFTGGVSALLIGWRDTTVDMDLHAEPEPSGFFEALPELKESLDINVELAAPFHFIPALPGWRERSVFIARHGKVDFFHCDFYSQALAKLERGHARDARDVEQMTLRELVIPAEVGRLFAEVQPGLIRYPAVDAAVFAARVAAYLDAHA
jgi:hypothetical protein